MRDEISQRGARRSPPHAEEEEDMDLPPEEVDLREVPNFKMPLLQIALLRRSGVKREETFDRCAHCQRSLLAGEHMFVCDPGRIVCELCVGLEPEMPREARLVHGPEFGNTIRIVDRRHKPRRAR